MKKNLHQSVVTFIYPVRMDGLRPAASFLRWRKARKGAT